MKAARCLPGDGWRQRLVDEVPRGPAEKFLAQVRRQVLPRVGEDDRGYGLECAVAPAVDGLIDAARSLDGALQELAEPLLRLAQNIKTTGSTSERRRPGDIDAPCGWRR